MKRSDSIYATPAQESYIAMLRKQAFAIGAPTEWGPTERRMLRSAASREIEMLKAAIAKAKH